MISTLARQNRFRLCLKNSSSPCNSDVIFSSFLLHFSTSRASIDPKASELMLHKHHFSPEAASQVASVRSNLRNPERSDSVISFLKESGFSKTQVEKMVICYPQLLSSNLENTIKPKIQVFRDMGFSENDVVEIISNDVRIFKQSLKNRIIPSLSSLKTILGSNVEVAKLLKGCGWFLETNLDNNLVQNVQLFKSLGLAKEKITQSIYYFPRFMLRKPEIVKTFVEKAEAMGASRSSRMFFHAVRVFSSMSDNTWEYKLRTFRKLGFTEDDITTTFRNAPLVFTVSEQKIKEVKEILLATGKYKTSCIVSSPVSMMYSVEKRYKPRIKVLEVLESKKVIERWPCLAVLCRMSDKDFYDKFVGPYFDQVGDVYTAKSGSVKKQKQ